MRSFVPEMVQQVASNAYEVKQGDNVGSIAEGLTGSPMRYHELVGANLHKPLMEVPGLDFQVFHSVQPGERLNLPASWVPAAAVGSVGYTPKNIVQLDALAGVLDTFLQAGTLINSWSIPAGNSAELAKVLAGWWTYLQQPGSGVSVPSPDINGLLTWAGLNVGGVPNTTSIATVQALLASAQSYVNAVGAIPYLPWDRVPWENWSTHFPGFLAALGNDPTAVMELLQFTQTIATIPLVVPAGNTWTNARMMVRATPYKAPQFATTDWNSPGYAELIKWIGGDQVDPSKVPWDVFTDPATAACIAALTPDKLATIKADPCWMSPGACNPLVKFKEAVCAPTYVPGWCDQPACKAAEPCVAKTCAQLGATCGKVDNGCGTVIDCGTCGGGAECPAGMEKNAQGVCAVPVAPAATSPWVYVGVAAGVVALGVGGYALYASNAKGAKRNPISRYDTNMRRI